MQKNELQTAENNESSIITLQRGLTAPNTNPYFSNNVEEAYILLHQTITNPTELASVTVKDDLKEYVYFKFKPENLNTEDVVAIEQHPSLNLFHFPVADAQFYPVEDCANKDDSEVPTQNYEAEEDSPEMELPENTEGFVWGVLPKNDALLQQLSANFEISLTEIETMFDIPETDLNLQWAVLTKSGHTCLSREEFKIKFGDNSEYQARLLRKLRGRVSYLDRQGNVSRGAASLQVFGLRFGIPVATLADANGNYAVPGRWLVGTILYTKAKNNRANIKPVDLSGTVAGVMVRLPLTFIVGSVHIHGWVGRKAMRNDINLNFGTHIQKRYWAQLLHITTLHDTYCATDNILSAPQNLAVYAVWGNRQGSASAPMLGKINPATFQIDFILNRIFNTNITVQFPKQSNLLKGLVPDITMHVSSIERENFENNYSAGLTQFMLHELAHASFFRKVDNLYWAEIITNTIGASLNSCGNAYGCSGALYAGNAQLNEAWAEFLGTNHALRHHNNGEKQSRQLGRTTYINALEREQWFEDEWINTGVFHDLMDVVNTTTANNEMILDRIGGATISQMYNTCSPTTRSLCQYRDRFIQLNPAFNAFDVADIFELNLLQNCTQF